MFFLNQLVIRNAVYLSNFFNCFNALLEKNNTVIHFRSNSFSTSSRE
nr:MAG TPA: hypothetical protein [Caudoviricetes sp.]DAP43040.1 MAG TPA: hypothetical protein [Caudoviricetes sp.]